MHTRLSPAPTFLVDSRATSRRLPSLASPAAAGGALSPAQRRIVVVAIAGLHLLAVWGLLQVKAVRNAAEQVVPILVSLLAPPAQPAAALTPPQPPRPEARPRTQPTPPPPQPAVVAATPTPTPAAFAAPEPPADTPPAPVSAAPAVAAAEPSPMPAAPATAPRMLPDAAVQYLEAPQVEYPKLSQRRAETGLVVVRAYVGTAGGAPHSVQVERSSGHARLDQAALTAVQRARFKPYAERGQPVEGWALIPIRFELDK